MERRGIDPPDRRNGLFRRTEGPDGQGNVLKVTTQLRGVEKDGFGTGGLDQGQGGGIQSEGFGVVAWSLVRDLCVQLTKGILRL